MCIEVIKNVCCIGVLTQWQRFKEYNLRATAGESSAPPAAGGGDGGGRSGGGGGEGNQGSAGMVGRVSGGVPLDAPGPSDLRTIPAGAPPLGASRMVSDSPKTTNARMMPQPMRVSARNG